MAGHFDEGGSMMIKTNTSALRLVLGCALAGVALLSGCASSAPSSGSGAMSSGVVASDKTRMTQSGFLTDYARLKTNPEIGGAECWRKPDVNWKQYDKVLIERMRVMLKPGTEQNGVDPSDLKALTDYFYADMVKALKPQMQIVEQSGPGVIRMRIAITDLVPTGVTDSLLGTAIPYGFVAEAGSGAATGRPAGSTPYMGETGIEVQLRDGATAAVLAECRDTEIGRKYAADMNASATGAAETWVNGYMSSFQSWSYAKDAFDKWSALTAKRFAALRGGSAQ
jgi:uncharacterized protein DUF3313